jgi:dUTP pyrophosphatase
MTNYTDLLKKEYAVLTHLDVSIVAESEDLIPEFAKDGDAGADLRAKENYTIRRGQQVLVKTGVKIELPKGTVALVCSRSGLALKHGVFVLNAPGIVDSGFRGELGVILKNSGDSTFEVKRGDRVAQLVLMKYVTPTWNVTTELAESERGDAGFGSTGKE